MDGKLPPPNPNLPYREDCWSEGETAALVDAWGSRYLDLNRGSLRQPQWREVADAVNSRPGASARRRPPRTDIQCKNRVDTLKKKYKAERARGGPSPWAFYGQLDLLVGPTLTGSKKSSPPRAALPVFRRGRRLGGSGGDARGRDRGIGWTVRVAAIGRMVQINRRQNKGRQATPLQL